MKEEKNRSIVRPRASWVLIRTTHAQTAAQGIVYWEGTIDTQTDDRRTDQTNEHGHELTLTLAGRQIRWTHTNRECKLN